MADNDRPRFNLPIDPTPEERSALGRFAAGRRWGRDTSGPDVTLDQILESLAVSAEVERRRDANYRANAIDEAVALLRALARLLLANDTDSQTLLAKLTELATLAEQERPNDVQSAD